MDYKTDYLGNVIKEGDEICFVTVVDRQLMRFTGYFFDGKFIEWDGDPKRPDEPCWKLGKYYKVFKRHNELSIVDETDTFTMYNSIQSALIWLDEKTTVLAIKGKSDNEQQYLNFIKS